ncbi:MAG: phosphopantetheine-binding protein, partial [Syntrophales bacterium]
DKRLVAYVVAKEGTAPSVSELRSFLRGRLPNYMVPAAFMSVDSMPLTPNGKVDLMRLSSLKQLQTDRKHLSDKPLTEMEKTVIDIWIEALGLDHISVHDNFFELGGHSLLSIQVIAQLEKRIGLRINVGELIYQTLGQLAASLERRTGDLTPSMRPVTQNRLLQAIKNKLFRPEHQE